MSRIQLLKNVVDGLHSLADDIQAIADALAGDETAVAEEAAPPAPLPLRKSRNSHLRKYGRYWRRKVTTASPRRSVSCWKSTEHRDCPKSIPPTMRHL